MASENNMDIVIAGETFNLLSVPNPTSKFVKNAKNSISETLDLASLVEDMQLLGQTYRVAYNGVVGCTELQIKVQRIGYDITELIDKSADTLLKFKNASKYVLKKLQATYQYLVDEQDQMALKTLSLLADVADEMARAAEEVYNDFDGTTQDVIRALEETQEERGNQEKKKKQHKEEKREYESEQEKVKEVLESTFVEEAEAKSFYNEAQGREDNEMGWRGDVYRLLGSLFTSGIGGGLAVAAVGVAACEVLVVAGVAMTVTQLFTSLRHQEAMRIINQEKMKHLEEIQKQQNNRREAIRKCIEFTERIKSCDENSALADAAIEAFHNSIGALKSLSVNMLNAKRFWRKMQRHCESLAKKEIQELVEHAIKNTKIKKMEVWKSTAFKTTAIEHYSLWVAIEEVCGVCMSQMKNTRLELYAALKENPTIEEARRNVRKLAVLCEGDLKKSLKEIEEKDMKTKALIKLLKDMHI